MPILVIVPKNSEAARTRSTARVTILATRARVSKNSRHP